MTNEKAWYLVQCKPRQEKRAKENLENQSISSFLPLISIEKVVRGKRQSILEPLFPGYIFIELPKNGNGWSKIRSTRGVRDFVRFAGVPGMVSAKLIQDLSLVNKEFVTNVSETTPKTGDKVRITAGPFKDLEGVFEVPDGEKRSIILLSLMGKVTKLEVLNSDLEKV
ncbi:transcription/translation regulatory transformer protein RfaH [Kangiella sediminilitoris]|uniref:Transcription antitermination protein RfaH n=1 Tax=Kangiella sediminilitoris TaxID=1144748 RepID=A0A1B3BBK7_9GAMM|nr:transcription/translation regulatory transformer protein RfaH [Kangiella sediminilitoris]AOE50173.1 Transcription antitermination protein RfaH [Kangiella sediminilitoris]